MRLDPKQVELNSKTRVWVATPAATPVFYPVYMESIDFKPKKGTKPNTTNANANDEGVIHESDITVTLGQQVDFKTIVYNDGAVTPAAADGIALLLGTEEAAQGDDELLFLFSRPLIDPYTAICRVELSSIGGGDVADKCQLSGSLHRQEHPTAYTDELPDW